jgi:hypothetical protein
MLQSGRYNLKVPGDFTSRGVSLAQQEVSSMGKTRLFPEYLWLLPGTVSSWCSSRETLLSQSMNLPSDCCRPLWFNAK